MPILMFISILVFRPEGQIWNPVMHQSFVVPAPMGPGNSGTFNFLVFKAPLNALPWGQIYGKIPAKSPRPQEADNNEEEQMRPGPFE